MEASISLHSVSLVLILIVLAADIILAFMHRISIDVCLLFLGLCVAILVEGLKV